MVNKTYVINPERSLDGDRIDWPFSRRVIETGGDEASVSVCVQCGTCSASCEVEHLMDYPPRMLVKLVAMGMEEEALKAESLWVCTGCYLCASRCPRGINITDVIEALKAIAMKEGVRNDVEGYYQLYLENVRRWGTLYEPELLLRYGTGINRRSILQQAHLGASMLLKGKIAPFPKKLKGIKGFRRMMKGADEEG